MAVYTRVSDDFEKMQRPRPPSGPIVFRDPSRLADSCQIHTRSDGHPPSMCRILGEPLLRICTIPAVPQKTLPLPRGTPTVGWRTNGADGTVRKGNDDAEWDQRDRPFDFAFFGAPLPLFFLSSTSCNLCCSAASTSCISGNFRMMEESERVGG